jgi:hypothetical protein
MVEHTGELIHTFRWLMVRAEMQDIEDFVDDVRMACNLPGKTEFRNLCKIKSGVQRPPLLPHPPLPSSPLPLHSPIPLMSPRHH